MGEGSALAASSTPLPVHTFAFPSPQEDAQTRHLHTPTPHFSRGMSPVCRGIKARPEEAEGLGQVWVEELGTFQVGPDWTTPQSSTHPAPLNFPPKLETHWSLPKTLRSPWRRLCPGR